MARTHSQQFADGTLLQQVLTDPLPLTRGIANGETDVVLRRIWEQAAGELAPIARTPGIGLTARLERRSIYTIAIVTPPAPRESGDPVAAVVVGRGDGITKLATIAYYVISVVFDATTGAPRFTMVARDGLYERAALTVEAPPLPDHRWVADYAFALYTGRPPDASDRGDIIPEVPSWYWWHAFDAASAAATFVEASDEVERFAAVRRSPILLLPEIAEMVEVYIGAKPAKRLRELRPYLRRDPSMAVAWESLADRLITTSGASAVAHALRAIPLIVEARAHGAIPKARGYELEAIIRCKLAALGVEPHENHAHAQQLFEAAKAAEHRMARGSSPPPIRAEDPVWKTIYLDEGDLHGYAKTAADEVFATSEAIFRQHAGLRAGHVVWATHEQSALAHVIDSRWVFRTAGAAAAFLHAPAAMAQLSDGLAPVHAPGLGDGARAFGGEANGRRTQILVIRIGRVIARVQATEGLQAAASRQVLHPALLHPVGLRIVQRAREGLAAYWLLLASPSNALRELVHSPGHDAARLLQKCPLIAHADLPASIAALGDAYAPVARSLASFQAQLRAHRWATYRDSMLSLVRTLLDTDMGDPRVNAAHAAEIVGELRCIDPDPVWSQLAAECEARA